VTSLGKLDTAGMENALSTFDALVDQLASMANGERNKPPPQRADEPRLMPDELAGMARIEDRSRSLVIVTRQLLRRATDHVAFDSSETLQIEVGAEGRVIGTPVAVVDAYNALVGTFYAP
jgi:hypothetical protein